MRVIVTRPAAQAQAWVRELRALGVDAEALPLICIEPAPDRQAVQQAWMHLDGAALVMFVSANAVLHFFEAQPAGVNWPQAIHAGATGPGTSAALRAAGVPADRIVEPAASGPFDTETLWQQLRHWPWAGRRVLVVRGEGGRDWLATQLRQAGAELDFIAAYRRVPPVIASEKAALLQAALAEPAAHRWHFSSSEAIAHLLQARPGTDWSASSAWATHPRIADTARQAGFGQVALVGVWPQDVAAAVHNNNEGSTG